MLPAARSACRAAQKMPRHPFRYEGSRRHGEHMSGQKVDLTALAPRDDRFATQSEFSGDAVTARAETDRRVCTYHPRFPIELPAAHINLICVRPGGQPAGDALGAEASQAAGGVVKLTLLGDDSASNAPYVRSVPISVGTCGRECREVGP